MPVRSVNPRSTRFDTANESWVINVNVGPSRPVATDPAAGMAVVPARRTVATSRPSRRISALP